MLRRRWRDLATLTALPPGTAQTAGGVLAALAAVACFGQVADIEMVQHGVGAGQPLSLGLAATLTAVLFGVSLARHFSERA